VFPDGELHEVGTVVSLMQQQRIEVRDVESLREHYVLTLGHWVQRLEERHEAAAAAVDEVAYRIWRLYMAGSRYAFRTGRLNLYQALFAKPAQGRSGLPLGRADWYGT
jgi:cyclopropane-fatty-acyl-phospholipid synthase